jgi:hypothetical protein
LSPLFYVIMVLLAVIIGLEVLIVWMMDKRE